MFATLEAGEPSSGATGGASVWYKWTPALSGSVKVTTTASATPLVTAYIGASLGTLTRVAVYGTCVGSVGQCTQFFAVAGTVYWIQVGACWLSRGWID